MNVYYRKKKKANKKISMFSTKRILNIRGNDHCLAETR